MGIPDLDPWEEPQEWPGSLSHGSHPVIPINPARLIHGFQREELLSPPHSHPGSKEFPG